MTAGIASGSANSMLDTWLATVYVKLHNGDPGAAGTANPSVETARKAATMASASGGSKAMTGTVSWTAWSAGSDTITHVSLWTASTGGTFIDSIAVTNSRTIANGDTLQLNTLSSALAPIAA